MLRQTAQKESGRVGGQPKRRATICPPPHPSFVSATLTAWHRISPWLWWDDRVALLEPQVQTRVVGQANSNNLTAPWTGGASMCCGFSFSVFSNRQAVSHLRPALTRIVMWTRWSLWRNSVADSGQTAAAAPGHKVRFSLLTYCTAR